MSDLTLSETIRLLFRAMDKPADFTGTITLVFGQNGGLRNPQISDRDLKVKLAPALKLIAQRGFSNPSVGGKINCSFEKGAAVSFRSEQKGEDRYHIVARRIALKTEASHVMISSWFHLLKKYTEEPLQNLDRIFTEIFSSIT